MRQGLGSQQQPAAAQPFLPPTPTHLQARRIRRRIIQALPGERGHIQQPGVAQRIAVGAGAAVQQQLAAAVLRQQGAAARRRRGARRLLAPAAHQAGAGHLEQVQVAQHHILPLLVHGPAAKDDHKAVARRGSCGATPRAGQLPLHRWLHPAWLAGLQVQQAQLLQASPLVLAAKGEQRAAAAQHHGAVAAALGGHEGAVGALVQRRLGARGLPHPGGAVAAQQAHVLQVCWLPLQALPAVQQQHAGPSRH